MVEKVCPRKKFKGMTGLSLDELISWVTHGSISAESRNRDGFIPAEALLAQTQRGQRWDKMKKGPWTFGILKDKTVGLSFLFPPRKGQNEPEGRAICSSVPEGRAASFSYFYVYQLIYSYIVCLTLICSLYCRHSDCPNSQYTNSVFVYSYFPPAPPPSGLRTISDFTILLGKIKIS